MRITGARILAVGGTTAAGLGMLGGFAGVSWLIGAANAVMLAANIAVIFGPWR